MTTSTPKPPTGLQASGRRLWRSVMDAYELTTHEELVLKEACRTADTIDALQQVLDRDGLMSESSQGERVHPAAVEIRQQRVVFGRLVAALRIPLDEQAGRLQRRGIRGVYAIRGGAS